MKRSILLIMFICCAFEWYALYSWLMLTPIYFTTIGISKEYIGLLLALEVVVYMSLQPIIGHVIDKLKHRSSILLVTALVYGILLSVLPYVSDILLLTLLMIGIAITSAPIATTIFSITSMYTPSEVKGFTMGLLFTFGYIGAVLGPLITGYLAELSIHLAYTHLVIPLAILSILGILVVRLKEYFSEIDRLVIF